MSEYDKITALIASTFPDIHWEVYSWHKYTGRPDVWEEGKTILVYGGFVDGWKYELPGFQATEGDEQSVIDAIADQIEQWRKERNPSIVARMFRALRALSPRSTDHGNP